ncbi:MAG: hypothetical protein DI533_01500 [Cereibacter sphaeroides]|uniref:Uncharacterized protein n=1 Tax=Cereibacter sphaeroides TaxID=1063 RepID=A0A2W5SBY4_CERSP|nr:MAG: hypothetical protein DI533_01500 [Cereibacter sphaeroides]
MIIHRNLLAAIAVSLGVAAMGAQAEAKGSCPGNWKPYHGTCISPNGKMTDKWDDKKMRGGFYPVERYDDRGEDAWLRNPERYGLPRLPRGQHYEIINGRVVRMYDDYRPGGDDNIRALQGLLETFLR